MIPQSEFRIFSKQPLRTNSTKEESISLNRSNPGKQWFSSQYWQLCKCVLNCSGHLIMAPNYANVFIHLLEQYFIYNSPTQPKTRQRQEASFRDDYLMFAIPTQLISMHRDHLGWALPVGGFAFCQSLWDIRRWAAMAVIPAEAVTQLAVLGDVPSRGSHPITSYLGKKSASVILSTMCEQIIRF